MPRPSRIVLVVAYVLATPAAALSVPGSGPARPRSSSVTPGRSNQPSASRRSGAGPARRPGARPRPPGSSARTRPRARRGCRRRRRQLSGRGPGRPRCCADCRPWTASRRRRRRSRRCSAASRGGRRRAARTGPRSFLLHTASSTPCEASCSTLRLKPANASRAQRVRRARPAPGPSSASTPSHSVPSRSSTRHFLASPRRRPGEVAGLAGVSGEQLGSAVGLGVRAQARIVGAHSRGGQRLQVEYGHARRRVGQPQQIRVELAPDRRPVRRAARGPASWWVKRRSSGTVFSTKVAPGACAAWVAASSASSSRCARPRAPTSYGCQGGRTRSQTVCGSRTHSVRSGWRAYSRRKPGQQVLDIAAAAGRHGISSSPCRASSAVSAGTSRRWWSARSPRLRPAGPGWAGAHRVGVEPGEQPARRRQIARRRAGRAGRGRIRTPPPAGPATGRAVRSAAGSCQAPLSPAVATAVVLVAASLCFASRAHSVASTAKPDLIHLLDSIATPTARPAPATAAAAAAPAGGRPARCRCFRCPRRQETSGHSGPCRIPS